MEVYYEVKDPRLRYDQRRGGSLGGLEWLGNGANGLLSRRER